MARDQKKRQKSLEKHRVKRQQKQQSLHASNPGQRAILKRSADWPILSCCINDTWQEPGRLNELLVARQSPEGEIAVGVFLLDMGCLGVKSAYGRVLPNRFEYQDRVRSRLELNHTMVEIDLDLAAKIVREAVIYARRLGFQPDPDYVDASLLLAGANPDACDVPIEFGVDGKPCYISGPYDDPARIVAILNRSVGPGNYEYLVALSPNEMLLDGDDDDIE